jgi:Mor family transcriptional regulator
LHRYGEENIENLTKQDSRRLFAELEKEMAAELGDAGYRAYMMLIEKLGGMRVSVPELRSVLGEQHRRAEHRKIRNLFDGGNITELAQRFGCSKVTIYKIVSRK